MLKHHLPRPAAIERDAVEHIETVLGRQHVGNVLVRIDCPRGIALITLHFGEGEPLVVILCPVEPAHGILDVSVVGLRPQRHQSHAPPSVGDIVGSFLARLFDKATLAAFQIDIFDPKPLAPPLDIAADLALGDKLPGHQHMAWLAGDVPVEHRARKLQPALRVSGKSGR